MSLLTTNEERQARVAAAASTRGLLVSLLGEFVRPHGAGAWTQTLIDVMGALDASEKATRQVLARLGDDGWLERSKDGRRTRWNLTSRAVALLDAGAQRIYRHGRDLPDWDGRWSVVLASVTDDEGADRRRLTVGLNWAGYGSLGQGTWISPWVDREPEAVRAVVDAGVVRPTSFVAELGALGDGRELVARAWDLDRLADDYATFADDAEALAAVDLAGADAVAAIVSTVHRWRSFPLADPGLPAELLPAAWPIERAAAAFDAVRAKHGPLAATWWGDQEPLAGSAA